MNILNRIKNFHPGPVCKSVVLFVVLLSLALIFWFLSLEHNTSNTSFFWVNVIDISWSLLFLACWIQLIRVDKIFKRNYPNKPGFLAKPTHPVRQALMVIFMTLAVILLFSSCVLWCASAVN